MSRRRVATTVFRDHAPVDSVPTHFDITGIDDRGVDGHGGNSQRLGTKLLIGLPKHLEIQDNDRGEQPIIVEDLVGHFARASK
nr:hypothetical protein CFP56_01265 [Quercus suber]